jgi:lysophospholipase L1-like esterase
VASELGFRALATKGTSAGLESFRRYLLTGVMRGFEARAYTNYQRHSPNSNAFGFLDHPWTRARTPGVPRIACLGGSTTESGNEQSSDGSYPRLLERTLEQRTGRDFEVLNAGVSGWTSAEMLVAWFLTLQDFAPDVVVLHEGVNDIPPRELADFRSDYSHWRKPIQTRAASGLERWLVRGSDLYVYYRLRAGRAPDIRLVSTDLSGPKEPLMDEGKLPHETSLPFRRNIASIARSAQADGRLVLLMTMPSSASASVGEFWRYGIEENNRHLRELGAELGLVLVDAAQAFQARPELEQQFTDIVHLKPPGNQAKAELVADALASWIASLSQEGARPVPRARQ